MANKQFTREAAVKQLQSTHHDINLQQAQTMVKRFKRFNHQLTQASRKQTLLSIDPPKFPASLAYNAAAVFRLMKTPGCIGLRCYPAIDDQQQFRLVIVGIDEMGNNILPGSADGSMLTMKGVAETGSTGILDEGQASPPFPPPENDL